MTMRCRRDDCINIQGAAKVMGKSTLFVREGMKRELLPIGYAMQMPSGRWTYFISPPQLAAYTGKTLDEVFAIANSIGSGAGAS